MLRHSLNVTKKLGLMALVLVALSCSSVTAFAIGVDKNRLEDPLMEQRAQSIMAKLRCLVCQNQSIIESDAELAQDLRAIVRERLIAGDSDDEVLDYMVARYGEWVLLKPPLRGLTVLLWSFPFILLGGGLLYYFVAHKRRKGQVQAASLSEAELEALEELLRHSTDQAQDKDKKDE